MGVICDIVRGDRVGWRLAGIVQVCATSVQVCATSVQVCAAFVQFCATSVQCFASLILGNAAIVAGLAVLGRSLSGSCYIFQRTCWQRVLPGIKLRN